MMEERSEAPLFSVLLSILGGGIYYLCAKISLKAFEVSPISVGDAMGVPGCYMEGQRVEIATKRVGETLIVVLEGELDLATAQRVRDTVDSVLADDARLHHLIWDLGQVGFIDSSGLGMLLGRYKKIRARKGNVVAIGALEPVRRMLKMAGMERIMQFADTEEQALARIGGKH